jgi:hypothetical protein
MERFGKQAIYLLLINKVEKMIQNGFIRFLLDVEDQRRRS